MSQEYWNKAGSIDLDRAVVYCAELYKSLRRFADSPLQRELSANRQIEVADDIENIYDLLLDLSLDRVSLLLATELDVLDDVLGSHAWEMDE